MDIIQQLLLPLPHHHVSRRRKRTNEKFNSIESRLAYNSRGFMPPTTAPNQSSDSQSIPYPQTSPLATHRPTRPTAVVPPLPKDPIISSPMGSMTTAPSMPLSASNYQQISPQKSSNYSKQVHHSKEKSLHTCYFLLLLFKFKYHIVKTVRNRKRTSFSYIFCFFCLDRYIAIT